METDYYLNKNSFLEKDENLLYIALINKDYVRAKELIENGTSPDSKVEVFADYIKPLIHYFISYNDETAVKFLLDNGASTELLNRSGNSPLMVAYHSNNFNIVKLLINYNANIKKDLNYDLPFLSSCA